MSSIALAEATITALKGVIIYIFCEDKGIKIELLEHKKGKYLIVKYCFVGKKVKK
jgi:hypothetical protein